MNRMVLLAAVSPLDSQTQILDADTLRVDSFGTGAAVEREAQAGAHQDGREQAVRGAEA